MKTGVSDATAVGLRASDLFTQLELRISPKPILAIFLVLGPVLYMIVTMSGSPQLANSLVMLSVLLQVLAATGWLLYGWSDLAVRWFTVLMLIAIFPLVSLIADLPGILTLMAIPVMLTAPLISLPAATGVALGEIVFLSLLVSYGPVELDAPTLLVALTSIGVSLAVMHAIFGPVNQFVEWAYGYYLHAQKGLDEALDRKVELVQALDDLAHANRQLMLANERTANLRAIAEEAQRTKTAFVANVSHEFRTPLNMILGLVELMVENPEIYAVSLSSSMRDDLNVVYRNCEHLANLINDVLDLTRMEAGYLTLHRERVDLQEIIEDSVTAIRPLMEKKRLALDVLVPDELPRVYCDRTRMQQVLLNLLSNAARYTDVGRITVQVVQQDQHVVISVADTGPGICSEDVGRIFEPFFQGSGEKELREEARQIVRKRLKSYDFELAPEKRKELDRIYQRACEALS